MSFDFISLIQDATSQIGELAASVLFLLGAASSIYLALMAWRLVKKCLIEPFSDDSAFPEDFEKANEGIMFDGDPSDPDAIDSFMAEAEQRYRDYITTDEE